MVIAWTYLGAQAREIFIKQMQLDENTQMRAKAWVLWKATYELCQMTTNNNSFEYFKQQKIIEDLLSN